MSVPVKGPSATRPGEETTERGRDRQSDSSGSFDRDARQQRVTDPPALARLRLTLIAVALLAAVVFGVQARGMLERMNVLELREQTDVFLVLYGRYELPFLILTAAFGVLTVLVIGTASRRRLRSAFDVAAPSLSRVATIAALVGVLAWGGWHAVMQRTALSMDEYVADYQAEIFGQGRLRGSASPQWAPVAHALTPIFVHYDKRDRSWISTYLPGYAAMRSAFALVDAESLFNPLLAALSVVLVFMVCKRLWPEARGRPWLAVLFLATSSQFLFTSMTPYAMPAHLFLSLLWLYLWVRGNRLGWLLAPWVGVVAIGLHQPAPHALFVLPFLVQLVLSRRIRWIAYFAVVYLAGIAYWYAWLRALPTPIGVRTYASVFDLPDRFALAVQGMSATIALSWQTPLMALLVLMPVFWWRSLGSTERALAAGGVLTFLFYFAFKGTQGHGWGYRYSYAVLGSMAIIAAAMARPLAELTSRRVVVALAAASIALTLLVQWPARALTIERFVRPFARAQAYVASLDAAAVVVDPTSAWYAQDLVRNDPFLRTEPKVLDALRLTDAEWRYLETRFGSRLHVLEPGDLGRFGIPTWGSRLPSDRRASTSDARQRAADHHGRSAKHAKL